MGVVIQKLRDSARNQVCAFSLPGICSGRRDTVVLCHCRIGHYAGASKPDDFFSAFGCFDCHTAIDTHKLGMEDELRAWLIAIKRTHQVWHEEGLMKFPETASRPRKASSKIMPHHGFVRR